MHVVYLHGFASSPRSSKALFLGERLAACGITLHCPDFNEPDFSTLTVSRMVGQVESLIDRLAPGPVALIGSSLGAFVAVHAAERTWRSDRSAATAGQAARGESSAAIDRGSIPPAYVAPRSHRAGDFPRRALHRTDAAAVSRGLGATRDSHRGLLDTIHPIERLVLLAPALDFGANRMKHLGPEGLARWRATNRLEVEHYAEGRVRHVHYDLYEDARRYDSFATTATMPTLVLQGRRDDVVEPAMVERYAQGRGHVTLVLLDDDHQLAASLEQVWLETAGFLRLSPSAA